MSRCPYPREMWNGSKKQTAPEPTAPGGTAKDQWFTQQRNTEAQQHISISWKIPKAIDLRTRSVQDSGRLLCPRDWGQPTRWRHHWGTACTTLRASASPRNRTLMGCGINCVWQSLKMCELFLGKKAVISGYTQKNKRQCHHSKAKKRSFLDVKTRLKAKLGWVSFL